jgi:hypothetical protein
MLESHRPKQAHILGEVSQFLPDGRRARPILRLLLQGMCQFAAVQIVRCKKAVRQAMIDRGKLENRLDADISSRSRGVQEVRRKQTGVGGDLEFHKRRRLPRAESERESSPRQGGVRRLGDDPDRKRRQKEPPTTPRLQRSPRGGVGAQPESSSRYQWEHGCAREAIATCVQNFSVCIRRMLAIGPASQEL